MLNIIFAILFYLDLVGQYDSDNTFLWLFGAFCVIWSGIRYILTLAVLE